MKQVEIVEKQEPEQAAIVVLPQLVIPELATIRQLFAVDEKKLEAVRAECADVDATTKEGYPLAVKHRATFRTTRVGIESKRVELKADSLEYGRRVDTVAKEFTGLLGTTESELDAKIKAVDNAKAAAKAAEEARKKAELEAKVRAEQEAEAARLAAIRAEEERKLAEQRAELERQQAEQAAAQKLIDAQRAAFEAEQCAAREKMAAEQKSLDDARIAAERAEADRVAKAKREEEAKAQAERERLARIEAAEQERLRIEREAREAEEARVAELERQAALAARLEALKPDRQKLSEYRKTLLAVDLPELADSEAQVVLAKFVSDLVDISAPLESFGQSEQAPDTMRPEAPGSEE